MLDAQRELITHPAVRLRHEVLEVPGASYRTQDWDMFEHRNKRAPVDPKALAAEGNPLRRTDFDLAAIIGSVLDDLLEPPAVDLRPAIDSPPVSPTLGTPPIGVRDVLFG